MGAIAWPMYLACLYALLALTGCAHGPAELEAVKRSVDSRLTYQYSTTKAKALPAADNRFILSVNSPAPQSGPTNCVGYALAYREALGRGLLKACKLPDGQRHAYLQADGYVMDNREGWVVKQGENCR
jgi:putative hemolysin